MNTISWKRPFRIHTIKGPWFSFGIHVDLQRLFIEIHFIWWIIGIGGDYVYGPAIGQSYAPSAVVHWESMCSSDDPDYDLKIKALADAYDREARPLSQEEFDKIHNDEFFRILDLEQCDRKPADDYFSGDADKRGQS